MEILLVEDNEGIVAGLEYAFKNTEYNFVAKTTVKDTTTYLYNNTPDIIILDVTLPDGDGFNLYREQIKDLNISTIFLTAKDDEDDIVKGLNLGAEDYITKPFSTKELMARINRVFARNRKNTVITVKDICFDMDKMLVCRNDKVIELTSLELKLLHLLFLNIGKTVGRNTILDKIWEWTGNDVFDHTVTVYLKRIREKLGTDIISTVKGIGYRIDEE